MAVPIIAIVGRPNVGKSSMFNWLAGKRIAIVDPTAGVTRDRVSTLVQLGDRYAEVMDTGGIGIVDSDALEADVDRQINLAIDQAQLILFVLEARSGVVLLDEVVAERLRKAKCKIIVVINKCDTLELEAQCSEFYKLGYGQPLPVSALQNRGKDELLRAIARNLPAEGPDEEVKKVAIKLAIVGRRNTGKSTFINQLAQSERVIVSEIPGTTRDSVDVRFERDGQTLIAIDTAGVRRKRSVKGDIEFYSMARAERSIRRADVVLLFFDAAKKVSMVDKKLVEYILEEHKPVIFVINKWDLLKDNLPTGTFVDYLKKVFPMLDYVPFAFITAKTGKNVQAVVNLAQSLFKQTAERVGTSAINKVLRQALADMAPPLRMNRRPKIYYGTQVATHPPTIVLFTNNPDLLSKTYQRYLLKTFRDHLPFNDVPIKLYLRARHQEEGVDEPDVTEIDPDETPTEGPRPAKKKKPKKKKPTHARPKAGKKRDGKSELWKNV